MDRSTETLSSIDLDSAVRHLLWRWRGSGAHWTSDIAGSLKLPTAKVRSSLLRLERDMVIVRVVKGNPSSWSFRP